MKILWSETFERKNSNARLIVSMIHDAGEEKLVFQIRGTRSIAERNQMMNEIPAIREKLNSRQGLEVKRISAEFPDHKLEEAAVKLQQEFR
jgi:hypothetical protein